MIRPASERGEAPDPLAEQWREYHEAVAERRREVRHLLRAVAWASLFAAVVLFGGYWAQPDAFRDPVALHGEGLMPLVGAGLLLFGAGLALGLRASGSVGDG